MAGSVITYMPVFGEKPMSMDRLRGSDEGISFLEQYGSGLLFSKEASLFSFSIGLPYMEESRLLKDLICDKRVFKSTFLQYTL